MSDTLAKLQSMRWDYPAVAVAQPVAVDDRNSVQTCKRCALPIQIFGRVMPCRHAFCFLCAKKKATETCPHCGNKVEQIDRLEGPYALIICQIPSASDVPCNRGYRNIQDLATHQIKNHSSAARAKSAGGSERRSSPSAAPSKG